MSNWKDHFSSLERQIDTQTDYCLRQWEDIGMIKKISKIEKDMKSSSQKPTKKSRHISKHDIETMLYLRHLVEQREHQKKDQEQNKAVKQSKIELNENSITSFLVKVLAETEEYLDINEIIKRAEDIGWDFEAFKIKAFNKAIKENIHLLQTKDKQYKLRVGLRATKPTNQQSLSLRRERNSSIPKLSDIIILLAKKHQTEDGIYPGKIFQLMNNGGLAVSYSYVRKVMQNNNKFSRHGFFYKTK